jgi:hypothetical protein
MYVYIHVYVYIWRTHECQANTINVTILTGCEYGSCDFLTKQSDPNMACSCWWDGSKLYTKVKVIHEMKSYTLN